MKLYRYMNMKLYRRHKCTVYQYLKDEYLYKPLSKYQKLDLLTQKT